MNDGYSYIQYQQYKKNFRLLEIRSFDFELANIH